MRRAIILFLIVIPLAFGATIRLYLKDGTYQLVREYQVLPDRVRYYTVERGDWEEIPLDLVDLKRTKAESAARDEEIKEESAALAAEEKAERDARKEVERIPVEPGVYLSEANQMKTIPPAETAVVMDKKRRVLQVLSPVPVLSGKGWLEMKGDQSKNVVASNTPEFYIRLAKEERFGIVRLKNEKGVRIVERINVIPVSKQIIEEQDQVEIFRRQVGDGLYKIWPMKPLDPGEYAVVEYTPAETEGVNLRAWDFAVPSR